MQNVADIKEVLKHRADGQPILLFVGPLDNFTSFYVVINGIQYSARSAPEALDTAFKAFFAVDIKYPDPAKSIWLFIQKVLYNIEHDYDKFGTPLNVMMNKVIKNKF